MLNENLMRWTEQHQLRARRQAGFRKDHRTRVQHSELFQDSDNTTVSDFMQQDAGQLAAFLRVCHDHCAELEGCTSNRD